MRRSTDRIITSHAGSLPRPPDLLAINQQRLRHEPYDEARRAELVRQGVQDVVRKQVETGIDSLNDGEFGKALFLDYGDRMSGFENISRTTSPVKQRRNMLAFADFYNELYPGRGGVGTEPA